MKTITYCIEKKLNDAELNLPIKFNNSKRNTEHYLSRKCLKSITKINDSLDKIELHSYQYLDKRDDLIFSLAHTKEAALAVSSLKEDFKSLGCDIEDLSRKVPENSQKHFINEEDDTTGLSLLETWCVKEACFKALSNSKQKITLLKEVVIKQKEFFYLKGEDTLNIHNRFHIIKDDGLIIVIAYCSNSSDNVQYKVL